MKRTTLTLFTVLIALSACAKRSADLELDAARKALANAKAKHASDCAHDTYQAAESALAEASQLADSGQTDKAKDKANQARTLAENAIESSSSDCEDSKQAGAAQAASGGNASSSNASASEPAKLSDKDVNQIVYFAFNEAAIQDESKALLSKVAEAMRQHPSIAIEIEGHCDVRGSTEYNLQLGERRARAVEKYLTAEGVKPARIQIISYGEERPIDLGTSEESHRKNRRAEIHATK